jgi:hypothetical protein
VASPAPRQPCQAASLWVASMGRVGSAGVAVTRSRLGKSRKVIGIAASAVTPQTQNAHWKPPVSAPGAAEPESMRLAGGHRAEEAGFSGGSELPPDEVRGFGDDEGGRDQRARILDRADTGFVVGVGVISRGEQDARIDDEQASVSAEAVGKKLVGVAGVATGS